MTDAAERAGEFLDKEKAFRLGELPTEAPHPKTRTLSQTAVADLPAAVRMLQSVDAEIPPVVKRVIGDDVFAELIDVFVSALKAGNRIYFTGCGATGRLAILLEAAWRRFWRRFEQGHFGLSRLSRELTDRVFSVMAGGDFALIKAVEGFEDFPNFGRYQLKKAGVRRGDVVVAVTEGGETPFVIGTAWEGLDVGADVFFVYNNPTDILSRYVRRSREVIEEPRIRKIDLATGPMAVTGSTRMQAVTIELLILGAAVEMALRRLLEESLSPEQLAVSGLSKLRLEDYHSSFVRLLSQLCEPSSVAAMVRAVRFEEEIYHTGGLVTYLADSFLLDVLTDTTERSPTFMLPPFRKADDTASPRPWSFVKDPFRLTKDAWRSLLGRDPRGLQWDTGVYDRLNAPAALRADPPKLDNTEIHKFRIGCESDPSRTDAADSARIMIAVGDEDMRLVREGFRVFASQYNRTAAILIGPQVEVCDVDERFEFACDLPGSPLQLWRHLAVKLVLNTISTATMTRMDRVLGNAMVWVSPSNKKLIDRGCRLISQVAGCDYDRACIALHEAMEEVQGCLQGGEEAPSPVALAIERIKTAT